MATPIRRVSHALRHKNRERHCAARLEQHRMTSTSPPRFRRYTPDVRAAMLIEAGLACLARGGIQAFTVDNICREADASRGLITHHFGSKDGLLAAVYAAAYRPFLSEVAPDDGSGPDLSHLINVAFSDALFSRENLNIWLALWSEIAVNDALRAEHRKLYALYKSSVMTAIERQAKSQKKSVDTESLAISFIALIDGYWLEQHIDPVGLSPERAKAACRTMFEPILGSLSCA